MPRGETIRSKVEREETTHHTYSDLSSSVRRRSRACDYVAAAVASAAPLLPPSASAISAADPRQAGFGRRESHSRPSS